MKTRRNAAAVVSLAMLLGLSGAHAQRAANEVQPDAINAMAAVGAKLRSLDSYSVEMDVRTVAALGSGRYRKFDGTVKYLVNPPARLVAEIKGSAMSRRVLYDGTNIVVLDPPKGTYARISAPGNLQTFVDRIKSEQGIALPIAELFTWGTKGMPMSSSTRARYEGTGIVGGRDCRHYSYLADSVAWEVWVGQDDLPCKLVMVDMADRGLPGYGAELKWNTDSKPADAEFAFTPAAGATEVTIEQMAQGGEPAPL